MHKKTLLYDFLPLFLVSFVPHSRFISHSPVVCTTTQFRCWAPFYISECTSNLLMANIICKTKQAHIYIYIYILHVHHGIHRFRTPNESLNGIHIFPKRVCPFDSCFVVTKCHLHIHFDECIYEKSSEGKSAIAHIRWIHSIYDGCPKGIHNNTQTKP